MERGAGVSGADGWRTEPAIADRYEFLRPVARGGQAVVFLARDIERDRDVAIKVRTAHAMARSPSAEADALINLPPHPNLPRVYDEFATDRMHCVAMEWIDGTSLAQLLLERGRPGLPVDEVAGYVSDLADALDHLHRHGVVHLDIKPANAVIGSDGRAMLVDLGIAWPAMHVPGVRRGTTSYLAPEVGRGGHPSPASDVFGLSVTTFMLLTGRLPEPGAVFEAGPVGGVRESLRVVLEGGLSTDPRRRPATAGEFARRLREAAGIAVGDRTTVTTVTASSDATIADLMRIADEAVAEAEYARAITMLESARTRLDAGAGTDRDRCEVLVRLEHAMVRSGDPRADDVFRAAADLALSLADGCLLGRLVTARVLEFGRVDPVRLALAERAIELLPAGDALMRARVMAYLGLALSYTTQRERGIALTDAAADLAREVGDRDTLNDVLVHRASAHYGPDNIGERLDPPEADLEVLRSRVENGGFVWQMRLTALLELGDLHAADRVVEAAERVLAAIPDPYWEWGVQVFRAGRALVAGSLREAEALTTAAFAAGQQIGAPDAFTNFAAQLTVLRHEQGRTSELIGVVSDFVEQFPDVPVWRAGLALMHADVGDVDEARRHFDIVAAHEFEDLRKDWAWLYTLALCCETCASVGDGVRATALAAKLAPYADRFAWVATTVGLGPVTHSLALAHLARRDADAATAFAEDAVRTTRSLAANAWLARALLTLARALHCGGLDVARARAVAGDAASIARELGMPTVVAAAEELG